MNLKEHQGSLNIIIKTKTQSVVPRLFNIPADMWAEYVTEQLSYDGTC